MDDHSQKSEAAAAHDGAAAIGGRHRIHCLTIVGQIEGHQELPPQSKTTKYEHVIPQLAAIEESDEIDGLLILLGYLFLLATVVYFSALAFGVLFGAQWAVQFVPGFLK